jgi:hypothetical protein
MNNAKPLGHKNYGSIPHLPGSRRGPSDKGCHEGQAQIATEKARDKNDEIIVQEKLDGSNVGVARIGDAIYPLGRAGWLAISSPYKQHRLFAQWAYQNNERFLAVLHDGERIVGEWLAQAHGTKYELHHEPFVPFDIMKKHERLPYAQLKARLGGYLFAMPTTIHVGLPLSIDDAMAKLNPGGYWGFHGAQEPVEGAVWRIERDKPTGKKREKVRVVDFLVKYVRPDKEDGKYLSEISGEPDIWNWQPHQEANR